MNPALALILVAVFAYLLGSIPFGLLLTRAAGLGDVRRIGSGSIGATNVLRTGRKDIAAATLLLDGGKGAAAVLLARAFVSDDATAETAAAMAAACAFLGHCFPVWLGFRGGKGVATFIGAALALAWPLGVAIAGVWLLTAAIFGYSSLAGLVMVAAAPVLALLAGATAIAASLAVMAALSWLRHAGNIRRLLRGEESKIGRKG
jgi:glycerol-3-phosphate acyltransferase PlsY